MRFRLAALAVLVVVAFGLAACSPSGPSATEGGPLKVVATTTVLADMVKQVGGAGVDVTSIVPKGGVVETFDPSPRDIVAISEADLVVMNGLGLDDWLAPVVQSAAPDVPVVASAKA